MPCIAATVSRLAPAGPCTVRALGRRGAARCRAKPDQKTPCMPTRLGLPPTRRPCPRPSQRIGGKRDERVLLLRRRTCSMSGTAGLPRVGRARSRPLRPPASPGEGAISADQDDATVLHREEPRPQGGCLRRLCAATSILSSTAVTGRKERIGGRSSATRPTTYDASATTQLSKGDAKPALDLLDVVVLDELGHAQKVRIGDLVQLTVRVKPAEKARKGRNPGRSVFRRLGLPGCSGIHKPDSRYSYEGRSGRRPSTQRGAQAELGGRVAYPPMTRTAPAGTTPGGGHPCSARRDSRSARHQTRRRG